VHVCATALLVASNPRTAVLVSNQDAAAPLAFRTMARFVLLCTFLIGASFWSARCIHAERLSSADCSMWVSNFPNREREVPLRKSAARFDLHRD